MGVEHRGGDDGAEEGSEEDEPEGDECFCLFGGHREMVVLRG